MESNATRLEILDLLRGLAAVFVAWHHLFLYAPESDLADQAWPSLGYMCYNYALYAVAIFFVLGGFTSSLSRAIGSKLNSPGLPLKKPTLRSLQRAILDRYIRLAIPYLVMLVCLLSVSWIANRTGHDLQLFETLSWPQVFSHLFFLQDLLGYGNFSAGTWYLCIDMQWVLFYLLLTFASAYFLPNALSRQRVEFMICMVLGLSSAWWFSREATYEPTLLYFASQIVLGLLLGWSLQGKLQLRWLLLYSLGIAGSLLVNPRPQLFVSLAAAGLIWITAQSRGFGQASQGATNWKLPAFFRWLSERSYSLFLVHYLVHAVVLNLLGSWAAQGPVQALNAMGVAFVVALGVAEIFYRLVDKPTQAWLKARRAKRLAAG
jgi:peptidoglycan/LPS O-acetylase OafA/YrhL